MVIFASALVAPFAAVAQSVTTEVWGTTASGADVERVTLENAGGMRVQVMTWGATLLAIETPDREGKLANITLSLGSFEEYEKGHPLFGSIVGRYANRIAGGGFSIDGKRHDLESVNAKTGVHIHGGPTGFQRQRWSLSTATTEDTAEAVFSLVSEDGHEGFPGRVEASVTYRLDNAGALTLDYAATTTAATHVNLTNHVYFNLAGADSGPVLAQRLQLAAEEMLEFDTTKIPTGRRLAVAGTPFDFLQIRAIGEAIDEVEGGGYDHCYAIDGWEEDGGLRPCARVSDPVSGRTMAVETTKPGVQLYTANHLKPTLTSPAGASYGPHHGFCLETQFFPDSPNRPDFPSSLLRPGQDYRHRTVFRFGVDEG